VFEMSDRVERWGNEVEIVGRVGVFAEENDGVSDFWFVLVLGEGDR
jgi:hypothetical protein